MPPETCGPSFLSVYIHETDYAAQEATRVGGNRSLDQGVMELTGMLHEVNPYVQTFRLMREWTVLENRPEKMNLVIHADRRPVAEHVRR